MSIYLTMAGSALLMASVLGLYARFSSFDYRKALMMNYGFLILGFAVPVGMCFAKIEIDMKILIAVAVYFISVSVITLIRMVMLAVREEHDERNRGREELKSQFKDEEFLLDNISISRMRG